MKKIIVIASFILLNSSCTNIFTKKDVFIGDWVISESSPTYSGNSKKVIVKITKEDVFYMVDFIIDGKSSFGDLGKDNKAVTKEMRDNFMKYQLASNKQILVNIMMPTIYTIIYNEDNKTITTPFGWFKRK